MLHRIPLFFREKTHKTPKKHRGEKPSNRRYPLCFLVSTGASPAAYETPRQTEKSTRNGRNTLDFRGFMALPSGFADSVPHGAGFILRRFPVFILRRISHGPPPHQIRGFLRLRGRRSSVGQSVEISIPPGGPPGTALREPLTFSGNPPGLLHLHRRGHRRGHHRPRRTLRPHPEGHRPRHPHLPGD